MKSIDPHLQQLLQQLHPYAKPVQRHLWLYDLMEWIRGDRRDVQAAVGRVRQIVAAAQDNAELLTRWHVWRKQFFRHVDPTPLLADFGFAPRTAFMSEFAHRLRRKWLPASPDTTDLAQLCNLLLPYPFDAQWLRALDPQLTAQLRKLFFVEPDTLPQAPPLADGPASPAPEDIKPPQTASAAKTEAAGQLVQTTSTAWQQSGLSHWQATLLEAITYNVSQITAIGFANEIRIRMTHNAETTRAFHDLHAALDGFGRMLHLHGPQSEQAKLQAQALRDQLQACRRAASTVYEHFSQYGVSIGLVFMLRQLRDRIQRANELLDCLLSPQIAHATTKLLARLVMLGTERRSLRKLWQSNSHLMAAKVAESHAETGEQYITRNAREWRTLLGHALGGGAAMGFAVWFKFMLGAIAMSIFWAGFAAGLNYAFIFVVIQLLHWTVATKQPAVTAPAMAAKLKNVDDPQALDGFVNEVAHLIRSQIIAILGNLVAVVPMSLLICLVLYLVTGKGMITPEYATKTLKSLHLWGPTLLFAAFTGVLLFASSIVAGWVENWFALHQIDASIAYHPRLRGLLGADRAQRWGLWLRKNISGLTANISLGFMLGLSPSFAQFFGIGLEVRHVTLVAGQVAASAFAHGWPVLRDSGFWWAVAATSLVGPINLAVSFYLAFSTALAANNLQRLDRHRIYAALRDRLRNDPGSFFFPPKIKPAPTVHPLALPAPLDAPTQEESDPASNTPAS
ncbi:MAG: site-specific recombinase [Brachymonas sp.]|nr:site-specific recombinase [Brachymonas sp.]